MNKMNCHKNVQNFRDGVLDGREEDFKFIKDNTEWDALFKMMRVYRNNKEDREIISIIKNFFHLKGSANDEDLKREIEQLGSYVPIPSFAFQFMFATSDVNGLEQSKEAAKKNVKEIISKLTTLHISSANVLASWYYTLSGVEDDKNEKKKLISISKRYAGNAEKRSCKYIFYYRLMMEIKTREFIEYIDEELKQLEAKGRNTTK